jgi:hypothetical protein
VEGVRGEMDSFSRLGAACSQRRHSAVVSSSSLLSAQHIVPLS